MRSDQNRTSRMHLCSPRLLLGPHPDCIPHQCGGLSPARGVFAPPGHIVCTVTSPGEHLLGCVGRKLVTGNRDWGAGTQALYAVKFIQRGELVDESIKKEVINHCMLMHENIARFREVILCPRHLAIVMEFAQGGDLFNAVQQSNGHKMNEPMARYFFQQLIAGLGYMHCQVGRRRTTTDRQPTFGRRPSRDGTTTVVYPPNRASSVVASRRCNVKLAELTAGVRAERGVTSVCARAGTTRVAQLVLYSRSRVRGGVLTQGMCHRDLKLENLLLTDNPPKLKICDFGYSKSMKWQSQAKSRVGTAAYIAPEVITAARGSQYNSEAVDVWSSGVVLHTMLAGMYPFCDVKAPNDETRTIRRILEFMKGAIPYTQPPGVSEGGVDLLRRMLVADPSQRININDIINHPWFQANLPRGCATAPSAPDPNFPQQSVEEMQGILLQAVVVGPGGAGMGAPATIAEHPPFTHGDHLDRQTSNGSTLSHGLSHNLEDVETFTPAASLTLADSGVEAMLES